MTIKNPVDSSKRSVKDIYIFFLFLVGCGPSQPKPPAPPPPMVNAKSIVLDRVTRSSVPEVNFGQITNQWSFEYSMFFKLTDSSPLATGKILDWEAQVIVVSATAIGSDLFLRHNGSVVNGNFYPGVAANGSPRIMIFPQRSDRGGFVKVSLGCTRKGKVPEYGPFLFSDEINGVFLLLKVPVNKTKSLYSGGVFGGRVYSPKDLELFRIGFDMIDNNESVLRFEQNYAAWSGQQSQQLFSLPMLGCGSCDGFMDSDGDLLDDCIDVCPFDNNKSLSVGICGCGKFDVDSDVDGILDCLDPCPFNRFNNIDCHVALGDSDGDGDVDMDDFAVFQNCYGDVPLSGCFVWDMDYDGVIGSLDLDIFRGCYSGPAIPTTCSPQ